MKHNDNWQFDWLRDEIRGHARRHGGRARRPDECRVRPDADDFGFGAYVGFGPRHQGPRPAGFGPGFSQGKRARRGALRESILALLAEEPMNGYQIMQTLGERTGGIWTPSPGAVYPTLNQLSDEGLVVSVESHDGGSQRVYELTDAGRDEAAKLKQQPWETFGVNANIPERMLAWKEIGKQIAGLGLAVKNLGFSGTPEQLKEATDILAEARRRVYSILAESDEG
jgi:DNA-binding PadR family transcriptional regulator